MNQWWAVYSWWLVLGLGFGVMLGLTRLYISMTTSRHYEQRANEVYQAQKVLRRIFHAARSKQQQHRWVARSLEKRKQSAGNPALEVTENRLSQIASESAPPIGSVNAHGHLLGRRFCKKKAVLAASHASATAADALPMTDVAFTASHPNNGPPSSPSLSRSASKASLSETTVPDLTPGLAQQLMSLAGPLHLSGDSNASTLSSARRKAGKCFDLLVQHAELLAGPADALASKQQPALVRERLLRWAYKSNLDSTGPNALFGADKVLDKEMFVSSVERCYKEQRLLTASVTTFDQINTSLIHFSMIVWCAVLAVFYFLAIGVGFTDFLVPVASLLISAVLIMGRGPSDFFSGAAYVLLARPYDIGDRITTADPGRKTELYSLVVKHVSLFRTHFLSSNGELLYIDNHAMINKSITNLTRSGPITLMIRVQVPLATSASKVAELVDGIRQYVEERSVDWTAVDILISGLEYEAGHLVMDIWATSNHPAHEMVKVYGARSALFLFIHAYMHSAGIGFAKPMLPVRVEYSPSCELPHM